MVACIIDKCPHHRITCENSCSIYDDVDKCNVLTFVLKLITNKVNHVRFICRNCRYEFAFPASYTDEINEFEKSKYCPVCNKEK
jgi:hypothetical protein